MTTHYTIQIIELDITLKLSYRSGKFFRIEKTKGKLSDKSLLHLGRILPPTEDDVTAFAKAKEGKVTYTKIVKEKSQYSLFTGVWFGFYESFAGVAPKFTGTDANSLKQIIEYLNKVCATQDEAFSVWKFLLDHWKHLSKFHQGNTDLKYINSKLNILLNEVKESNADSTTNFNKAMSSDLGKQFKFK